MISKDVHTDCGLYVNMEIIATCFLCPLRQQIFSVLNLLEEFPQHEIFMERVRIFLVPLSMLSISDHK